MQRVERETTVCAKAKLEPESGITGKGDRRREKVLLSDAGKWCQVDEKGGGRIDGQLNYTVHLNLTRSQADCRGVPLQSLAEGSEALSVLTIYFRKEVLPLLCISKPQQ